MRAICANPASPLGENAFFRNQTGKLGTKAQQGRVAVMRGPCVYALALGESSPEWLVDCWDLDDSQPLVWNAAKQTVDATFRRNVQPQTRTLSLTRYCADIHDRTYFDLVR